MGETELVIYFFGGFIGIIGGTPDKRFLRAVTTKNDRNFVALPHRFLYFFISKKKKQKKGKGRSLNHKISL